MTSFNLNCHFKTVFPNIVTFWGAGVRTSAQEFWWDTIQPTTDALWQERGDGLSACAEGFEHIHNKRMKRRNYGNRRTHSFLGLVFSSWNKGPGQWPTVTLEEMLEVQEERKRGDESSGRAVKENGLDPLRSARSHPVWVDMAVMWAQSWRLCGFSLQLCSAAREW